MGFSLVAKSHHLDPEAALLVPKVSQKGFGTLSVTSSPSRSKMPPAFFFFSVDFRGPLPSPSPPSSTLSLLSQTPFSSPCTQANSPQIEAEASRYLSSSLKDHSELTRWKRRGRAFQAKGTAEQRKSRAFLEELQIIELWEPVAFIQNTATMLSPLRSAP